jgi:hypothetical protein
VQNTVYRMNRSPRLPKWGVGGREMGGKKQRGGGGVRSLLPGRIRVCPYIICTTMSYTLTMALCHLLGEKI